MPRQALYACKTCPMKVDPSVPGGTTKYLAGFCYGCSIACHEGHELVELYTKRNFRCDCGSDRFEGLKCQITDKTGVNNDENAYNHNFTGLYCTCNRPYPVPDDPDTQMQCAICEDWFHSAVSCVISFPFNNLMLILYSNQHLKVPEKNNADEIICMLCASKCKFLVYYIEAGLINLVPPVPVESIEEPGSPSSGEQAEAEVLPKVEIVGCKLDHCKKLYIEKHGSEDVPESSCNSTLLLDKSYRGQLCQCEKCLELYNQLKIDFIISQEDMLYYFERKNLEEADNRYRRELDKIDHVTKMTAIEGYKTLKRKLEEFLNSFRNGEIVSTERALEFCQQLDSERHKRRR